MMNAKSVGKSVVEDPKAHFNSPADLASDRKLSVKTKAAALAKWEQDARLLQVATEEGMAGGEPNQLDEVNRAMATLPVKKKRRRPSPTKLG